MIDVLGRVRPLILNVLLNELAFSRGGASSEFVRFSTQLPTRDLCQSRRPLVGTAAAFFAQANNRVAFFLKKNSLLFKCGSLGKKKMHWCNFKHFYFITIIQLLWCVAVKTKLISRSSDVSGD